MRVAQAYHGVVVRALPDARGWLAAGALALLTVLAAHLRLPLPYTPVPATCQTLVVLLAGGLLGTRLGMASQLLYMLLASVGLPVVAGPTLLGATGGYLVGFVAAAAIMGICASRRQAAWLIMGAVGASLAIYACGAGWLCLATGCGPLRAVTMGVAPFVAGDAIKAALAIGIISASWRVKPRAAGR